MRPRDPSRHRPCRGCALGARWRGVHTGEAFIGAVGKGDDLVEITPLGDAVNLAARLASAAATGELLASEDAFAASGVGGEPERRVLSLKGITAPVTVRVLRVDSA